MTSLDATFPFGSAVTGSFPHESRANGTTTMISMYPGAGGTL